MSTVYRLLGLMSIIFVGSLYSVNKIVYFISPPRSLSVAFLRMMQERGDFLIMHEPSQWIFNHNKSSDCIKDWFRPTLLDSYAKVKEATLRAAQDKNVFVKEMSFAVEDFHCNDTELMKNPQVYFVFLMRNPHHSIISLYKKIQEDFDLMESQIDNLVGYKALYNIFSKASIEAEHKPYLMLTEDLYNNPQQTIQQLCEYIGVEFKPEALHWNDLGENFDGQELWHELKYKEITHHWHGDAIRSNSFGKPGSYEVDAQGNPTFSEVINNKHRAICEKVYRDQLPYYELLLKNAKNL